MIKLIATGLMSLSVIGHGLVGLWIKPIWFEVSDMILDQRTTYAEAKEGPEFCIMDCSVGDRTCEIYRVGFLSFYLEFCSWRKNADSNNLVESFVIAGIRCKKCTFTNVEINSNDSSRAFPYVFDVKRSHESVINVKRERAKLAVLYKQNSPLSHYVSILSVDKSGRIVYSFGGNHLIGYFSLIKSSLNQPNTNGAQGHAYDSSSSHNESPKGGLALGYKIALIVCVLALCIKGVVSAFVQFDAGNSDTGFGYLIASVFGIFGTLIIGLPFVFGGF